jgi:hypothetical protein
VTIQLLHEDHVVFSPLTHSHSLCLQGDLAYEFDYYKNQIKAFIKWCDDLFLICLPGYKESRGVNYELGLADAWKKDVVFIEDDLLKWYLEDCRDAVA